MQECVRVLMTDSVDSARVCGCLIGTVAAAAAAVAAAAFLPADLYLGSEMHMATSVILCSVIIAFIHGRYTFRSERVLLNIIYLRAKVSLGLYYCKQNTQCTEQEICRYSVRLTSRQNVPTVKRPWHTSHTREYRVCAFLLDVCEHVPIAFFRRTCELNNTCSMRAQTNQNNERVNKRQQECVFSRSYVI